MRLKLAIQDGYTPRLLVDRVVSFWCGEVGAGAICTVLVLCLIRTFRSKDHKDTAKRRSCTWDLASTCGTRSLKLPRHGRSPAVISMRLERQLNGNWAFRTTQQKVNRHRFTNSTRVPIALVGNVFTTSRAEDLTTAVAEVAFFEWEIIVVESG